MKKVRIRARWAWRKLIVQLADPRARPRLLRRQGAAVGEDCSILTTFLGTEPQLVSIGNHCLIAGEVVFLTHDTATWSTDVKTVFDTIVIGNDVFVGQRAILLPGTHIGDGAIIGAGAVVRGEVPEGMVYAGNPARAICTTTEYREKQTQRRLAQGLDPFAYGKRRSTVQESRAEVPLAGGRSGHPTR